MTPEQIYNRAIYAAVEDCAGSWQAAQRDGRARKLCGLLWQTFPHWSSAEPLVESGRYDDLEDALKDALLGWPYGPTEATLGRLALDCVTAYLLPQVQADFEDEAARLLAEDAA